MLPPGAVPIKLVDNTIRPRAHYEPHINDMLLRILGKYVTDRISED